MTALLKKITAQVGRAKVKLTRVSSMNEFLKGENVFYYDEDSKSE